MTQQPTAMSFATAVAEAGGPLLSWRVCVAARALLGSMLREDLPLTWPQAGNLLAVALSPSFDALTQLEQPPEPVARAAAELPLRQLHVVGADGAMQDVPAEEVGVHPLLAHWTAATLGSMLGQALEHAAAPAKLQAGPFSGFGVQVRSDGHRQPAGTIVAMLLDGAWASADFGTALAQPCMADEQRTLRPAAVALIAERACAPRPQGAPETDEERQVRLALAEASKATIQ